MIARMCAKNVPEMFVTALTKQVKVEITNRRPKAIRVVGDSTHIAAIKRRHAICALIVEVLAKQGAERESSPRLAEVEAILPGFTGLTPIKLSEQCPAVGKSLAELDLRAKTGASVLAITRGDTGTANPSPREPLRGGDVLAVAGSAEAIASAREMLLGS